MSSPRAIACLLLLIVTGAACSKDASSPLGEAPLPGDPVLDPLDSVPNTTYAVQPPPVLDINCLNNTVGNLCLPLKNPVAQKQAPLNDASRASAEIVQYQTYAYTLKNTGADLLLDNSRVRIDDFTGAPTAAPAQTANGEATWKLAYSEENADWLAKANAFFWWNYGIQKLADLTHYSWTAGRRVRLFVGDSFNGFSGPRQAVHLKNDPSKSPMAMDASIIVFYLGVAEAWYASNGALFDVSTSGKYRACVVPGAGLVARACCTSSDGCAGALISGIGEFMTALQFPDAPALGELVANSTAGLTACGVPRNASANANLTAASAFTACRSNTIGDGFAVPLGSLYASIWWQLQLQAKAMGPSGEADIARLFLRHLELLRGDDDLRTARDKILFYDAVDFGGRYNQIIRQEFYRRGLGSL